MKKSHVSAKIYILKALIPYSKQNLDLTFHPTKFFDDLEKLSGFSEKTLRQSYTRLKKDGYITGEALPSLTDIGNEAIRPYTAKKLKGGAKLMVIFDIPEDIGMKRRKLRALLQLLKFTQIQRSVWVSENDHVQMLRSTINDLQITEWVELYEVSKLD